MLTASGYKRGWIVGTTALLCLLLVGSTVGVVAAASTPAYVSVASVTVSDEEPTTGDTVVVTPTIQHSSAGSGGFEVTEVALVDASGTQHTEVNGVGVLGAGDTAEVPLTASFATAGNKRLTVHVRGKQYDADGRLVRSVHLTHPAYVSVSEPAESTETVPQLHIETGRAVAGTETSVEVQVSNGGTDKLTDLSVRLEGLDGRIEDRTAIEPVLAGENSTTFRFTVRPPASGEQTLKATLRYGDGESVEAFDVVDVEPLHDEVSVYATAVERNDSFVLRYRVMNHGNALIEDVALSAETADGSLPSATVSSVGPASSETTTVELNSRPTGTATVTAAYDVGSEAGQVDQTVTFDTAASADPDAGNGTELAVAGTNAVGTGAGLFGPGTFVTGLLVGGVAVSGVFFGYRRWRTSRTGGTDDE